MFRIKYVVFEFICNRVIVRLHFFGIHSTITFSQMSARRILQLFISFIRDFFRL